MVVLRLWPSMTGVGEIDIGMSLYVCVRVCAKHPRSVVGGWRATHPSASSSEGDASPTAGEAESGGDGRVNTEPLRKRWLRQEEASWDRVWQSAAAALEYPLPSSPGDRPVVKPRHE